MKDLQVSLPRPCNQSWEAMEPRGCNRHCAVCDATIHDLAAMTLEEAEALLETGTKVCVRAHVRPGGVVSLAESRGRASRRMVAAVGASLTLAAAACQTSPVGSVSPRYEVSVEPQGWFRPSQVKLHSSNGRTHSPRLGHGRQVRFGNLPAGTYSLSVTDSCGETHYVEKIVVRDSDVDLGKFTWEEGCIIVGVIERVDKGGYG